MITPTPTIIDKYQIIKPLGTGNFSQVYHVFDRALQTEKAIKVLLSTDPDKFMDNLEEAQILNKCQHKHIISINEANIFPVNGDDRVVLDLEYIPEGSLEDALQGRWVSIKETITYIRGILLGLEHAHIQGFLHRDIKPGNILLAPTAAKLSDFGLATDAGLTLVGSANGYHTHLPPEFYSNPITSELTDVFAVGITLFRSLSNISDWRSIVPSVPNLIEHMQAGTLFKHIGFKEFIPEKLKRIVRKACHPDPTKRFVSSHEFGQCLDRLRFNIDWVRLADNEWQGNDCSNKVHRCYTDLRTNKVTVTVNNRRVLRECQKFNTLLEATTYMHTHIASTTLK